jgi:hypothetical protein
MISREPDKHDAIKSLAPEISYFEDEGGNIVWKSGHTKEDGVFVGSKESHDFDPPTDKEIEQELIRLHNEWKNSEYARKRKWEYPTIGDQLDALFHAGVFPEEMAAQIQAVKDEYPKPEELNG